MTREPFLPSPSEPSLAGQLPAQNAVLRAENAALAEWVGALEGALAEVKSEMARGGGCVV